jgi:DnaJ-class molecular chaperone
MQGKEKNYYNILHADRNSDEAALKKCFHKAALIYHPDKGGSDQEF